MRKTIISRMTPEFHDFLKDRATNFNTSIPRESKNILTIMAEVERKIGIDFKNSIVTKNGVKLQSKKRITILK